ncbi:hypothetical protein DFH28DRAFT_1119608 [Melampsora americana]|nr:hypothetical protein DFH28DRAFT_1119608 [Melampsora americana]
MSTSDAPLSLCDANLEAGESGSIEGMLTGTPSITSPTTTQRPATETRVEPNSNSSLSTSSNGNPSGNSTIIDMTNKGSPKNSSSESNNGPQSSSKSTTKDNNTMNISGQYMNILLGTPLPSSQPPGNSLTPAEGLNVVQAFSTISLNNKNVVWTMAMPLAVAGN